VAVIARHVIGCHLTQEMAARNVNTDSSSNICQAVPRPATKHQTAPAPDVAEHEGHCEQALEPKLELDWRLTFRVKLIRTRCGGGGGD